MVNGWKSEDRSLWSRCLMRWCLSLIEGHCEERPPGVTACPDYFRTATSLNKGLLIGSGHKIMAVRKLSFFLLKS